MLNVNEISLGTEVLRSALSNEFFIMREYQLMKSSCCSSGPWVVGGGGNGVRLLCMLVTLGL